MKRERNRHFLNQSISQLPVYQPGDERWENIANILDSKQKQTFISKLSRFEPPEEIWRNIEQALPAQQDKKMTGKARRLVLWSLAGAAVILLGIFFFVSDRFNQSRLQYSEEWISVYDRAGSGSDDSLAYRMIQEKCIHRPEICRSDAFVKMKGELDFLDQSRLTILNRINPYERNDDLDNLLKRIDAERGQIIHRMVNYVN